MTEEKTFPLEKILTVSLDSYITFSQSTDVFLAKYDLVGVHVEDEDHYRPDVANFGLIKKFAQQVPKNALVVVDYRTSLANPREYVRRIASGTALVPKK